jgi:hypothetical protein
MILAVAGVEKGPPRSFNCQKIKTSNREYFKDDVNGNLVTDLAILGFAVKVKDNETDGDKFKAFIANIFFKKLIDKTVSKYQELYDMSYASICEMDRLQRDNAPIGDVLAAYGKTMENAFAYCFKLEEKYLKVFNLLARWLLLVDMIDDYNDDKKTHSPNSLMRDDCDTVQQLFDKYYYELIPFIQEEGKNLKDAILAIQNDRPEWKVLYKVVGHALSTVIPNILSGNDVHFHYFKETVSNWRRAIRSNKIVKKYETNTVNN